MSENIKWYDWRVNEDGDEAEYQTPTGRYMHASDVLRVLAALQERNGELERVVALMKEDLLRSPMVGGAYHRPWIKTATLAAIAALDSTQPSTPKGTE